MFINFNDLFSHKFAIYASMIILSTLKNCINILFDSSNRLALPSLICYSESQTGSRYPLMKMMEEILCNPESKKLQSFAVQSAHFS